jgi:hypothetical protein
VGETIIDDPDTYSAFLELVSGYSLSPEDLLRFLLEQRLGHLPRRHLRAQIRKLSKIWKDVERVATKATKHSEGYLGQGQVSDLAMQIQNNARRLSRFFIEPVQKRPLEGEISDCKEAILSFLRKRGVRKTNEYGWILLRAIFGVAWKAGGGKDQIECLGRFLSRGRKKSGTEKTYSLQYETQNSIYLRKKDDFRSGVITIRLYLLAAPLRKRLSYTCNESHLH